MIESNPIGSFALFRAPSQLPLNMVEPLRPRVCWMLSIGISPLRQAALHVGLDTCGNLAEEACDPDGANLSLTPIDRTGDSLRLCEVEKETPTVVERARSKQAHIVDSHVYFLNSLQNHHRNTTIQQQQLTLSTSRISSCWYWRHLLPFSP